MRFDRTKRRKLDRTSDLVTLLCPENTSAKMRKRNRARIVAAGAGAPTCRLREEKTIRGRSGQRASEGQPSAFTAQGTPSPLRVGANPSRHSEHDAARREQATERKI